MIRLKKLLQELSESNLSNILRKIDLSEFKFIGQGDNSRVYKINNEDVVFKITTSIDELEVARKIQNKLNEYSTFIPVYYVGNYKNSTDEIIIMANAEQLDSDKKRLIDKFHEQFKQFAYNEGGEVSVFDFLDSTSNVNPLLENFLRALQQDINKLAIPDLDLDLDFRSDNIMVWSGKMVMVDW